MAKRIKRDAIEKRLHTSIGNLRFLFWDKDVCLVLTPDDEPSVVNSVKMYVRMDLRSYDDGKTFEQKRRNPPAGWSESQSPGRNYPEWNALLLRRVDHKDTSAAARKKVIEVVHEAVAEILKREQGLRLAAADLGRNNDLATLDDQLEEAEKTAADLRQQVIELENRPLLKED